MNMAISALRPLAGAECRLAGASLQWGGLARRVHALAGALGATRSELAGGASPASWETHWRAPWAEPVCVRVETGWGTGGGEWLQQAASGLMAVHGRARGGLRPLGLDYLSALASVQALSGGLACLAGQLRGGRFSECTLDWRTASLQALGQYLAGATASEEPEALCASHGPAEAHPPFVSAEGRYFELEALDAGPWLRFWRELGVPDALAGEGWRPFQLRYARAIAPLPAGLRQALAARSYADIAACAQRAGMALCPVRSHAERCADRGAQALAVDGPWRFALGAEPAPAPACASGDLPLSGLTVVESCRRIQGPLAGHLLAQLGARVIRIEPPGGDSLRGMPPMAGGCSARFDALNHLKTVVELDLKTPAGRQAARELARQADVFLHNWAPGKAAEFALDADDLLAVQPGLVHVYAGGWRDEVDGEGLPGTDFMAQAYCGVADQLARADGARPGSLFTALDVLGGALAAQAACAGLVARLRQQRGVAVYSSLAGAAHVLLDAGLHSWRRHGGVFATAQGWLALECPTPASVAALARWLDTPADTLPGLQAPLAARLRQHAAADALPVLAALGAPAVQVTESLAHLPARADVGEALGAGMYSRVNVPWRFA